MRQAARHCLASSRLLANAHLAMQLCEIANRVTLGRERELALERGTTPTRSIVRVALGTGYTPGEGKRPRELSNCSVAVCQHAPAGEVGWGGAGERVREHWPHPTNGSRRCFHPTSVRLCRGWRAPNSALRWVAHLPRVHLGGPPHAHSVGDVVQLVMPYATTPPHGPCQVVARAQRHG